MTLSIIIVNYNVKHFLEHCLSAVAQAIVHIDAEVYIVDNASTDGSMQYFEGRFPAFKFLYQPHNLGFAKGNNMALPLCTGKYILYLNPDTIVPEDAFTKCIQFMESTPNCGGLGVRMVDGSGNFLKESKRAFPSPTTALYKLCGMAALFPNSKKYAKYHLGHLSNDAVHEIDVIAGAYMMVRHSIIQAIGSFDESFFMYGEDVDLSYRIQHYSCPNTQAQYKNYYLPQPTIIHFKGESTKRGSLNYVKMFYKAMSQFVEKHYGNSRAAIFNKSIQLAILIRAFVAGIRKVVKWVSLPIIDAGIIVLSIWGTKLFWFAQVKPDVRYNRDILVTSTLVYTTLFVSISFLCGLYDKPYQQRNLSRSALVSLVILLAVYGALPEYYRFSRGIIIGSAFVIYMVLSILRKILISIHFLEKKQYADAENQTVTVANEPDYIGIIKLYEQSNISNHILGNIGISNLTHNLGVFKDFDIIKKNITFKEVVYSASSLPYHSIIAHVIKHKTVLHKFYHNQCNSIISSHNKDAIGQSITEDGAFAISTAAARRTKRIVDVSVSLALLVTSPVVYFLISSKKRNQFFGQLYKVLANQLTFVGYSTTQDALPYIKPAIMNSNGNAITPIANTHNQLTYLLDYRYAKKYHYAAELTIIIKYYTTS